MSAPTTARPNPAPVKVICLGLGRTGTLSLMSALVTLGFGPCYHGVTLAYERNMDFPTWCKIGDGEGTPEDFDTIFRGYSAGLDYPVAMYGAELHAAYPDAKFILTIRDPAKWEKSMKDTILAVSHILHNKSTLSPLQKVWIHWRDTYVENKYHRGRLQTHAQQEFLDHTERVKSIIPSEKLLIYEVGEGWERLAEFLDVPKPEIPFPHVNDTAEFQEVFIKGRLEEGKSEEGKL